MRLTREHAWAQDREARAVPVCARCHIPATSGSAAFPCPATTAGPLPADGTREAHRAAWRQSQEAHR